jgi:hypothetical protein
MIRSTFGKLLLGICLSSLVLGQPGSLRQVVPPAPPVKPLPRAPIPEHPDLCAKEWRLNGLPHNPRTATRKSLMLPILSPNRNQRPLSVTLTP